MSRLIRDLLAPFRRRTAPAARSPLAEAEPVRSRRGSAQNRVADRPARRRRAGLGAAENLERRLALAVVTPFDVRFTANDTGDITFAANTIMTAPGDSERAQLARAGIPDPVLGDAILNDDFWEMAYVDIDGDPTTFNSSAADIVLPTDAEVLFAGLYWGGRARGQTQFDNFGNVKFRGPDDAAYRNLSTTIISSTTQGAPTGSGARNYQSFIDVTDIVQAQGAGTYTTANVQAFAGAKNYSAGWSLVVAFREPGAPARNLTVFDGFAYVTTSDADVTINISGFQAPPAGPVTGTLGFVAYEGDLGIVGDRAFFNGGLGEQQLSNATNPPNNFFNSSISDLGVSVTTKNPDYVNQLGFGADLLAADGLIANGATAGTVRLTTTQDFYYPGVITSAIDLYAPKVSVVKGVTDLDGGEVLAGDTLRYTITVSNAASALDAAVGVLLEDALPANTTYVPGSLVITAGANPGGKTDAADADQGEYIALEEEVRFQLGSGAGGALPTPLGGRLAPGESTTVSFDVTINPDVLAGTIISNTSRASFTAETSRFELFASSNRAEVTCRPSADLAITKTDGNTSDVPGTGLTYTIVVTNNGPDAVTGATVTDTLPSALLGAAWTVSYTGGGSGPAGGSGNIATAVNLPALATATFVVTATIDPLATGTLSNTATVLPPAGVTDRNLANNTATDTTILLPEADLAVVKTRTSGEPVAGASVSYLISVTNNGPSTILSFTLTDTTAPALIGATFGTPSMGSYNSATGAWTGLMLATGESVTITLTGTVPGAARGDLENTAVVSPPAGVTDPDEDNNTSTVTDVIALVADLNVVKIRTSGQPVAGEEVTYQITVTNQGPTTIDSFIGIDLTTPTLEDVEYTVNVGSYNPVTGLWTGPALATGASVVFTLTGTVPAGATGSLVNTATVSPPPGVTDPDPSDDSSTVTDRIDLVADLVVVKTRTSGVPVAGAAVEYLITVTNDGPSTILGFTLLDTTAPALIGATFGTPSMGSYNSATGAWTGLMLATGESVTITLTGTVPGAARGDLENTAVVSPPAGVTDPDEDNNTSTVTDVIALVADLNVVKVRTSGQPVAGEEVTYQITVTNQGPTTIDSFKGLDVTVPDLLSPSYTVSTGTYDPDAAVWTGPALATGGTVVFTVSGTVPPEVSGLLINVVVVDPPDGVIDPDPTDNRSEVIDEITLVADLAVVKTRTSGQPVAGLPVTYEIVVTNFGPSSVTSFTGTDMSSPMLEDLDFTVSTGSYDPVTGLWTADPGDLFATGETVTFTLTGTVPAGATGLLVNTATGQPPDGVVDPDEDNNTSTVIDEISGVIDLTATKTGDVTYKGGGPLNFTVVVTNLGPSFASGVRVTDALPAGVVSWSWSVSYTGVGSGTVDGSPDSVVDSSAGIDKLMDLAVLGTATFTITALTDEGFESDITNTVVATLGQELATASWTSAYDGPINPTQDVTAIVVSNDDLCFGLPFVRVLDPTTGAVLSQFLAYEPSFRGSVRVATGDLTGDGVAEIIVAPGRNRIGQIRVFTPEGVELTQYRTFPFGRTYRGGVDVAVGDIDGNGVNEIIASRSSGLSRVNVFAVNPLAADPVANLPIRSFVGIPGAYRNGAVITAGDYGTFSNGMMLSATPDGIDEIAVGPNAGIGAQVRVFDVAGAPRLVRAFAAIRPGFRGGVTLSSARWDGDGVDDILVGAGVGGQSIVEVYGGGSFSQLARLAVFSSFGRPNAAVNVAALDIDGDGLADDLYGVQGRGGSGGTRGVRRFDRITTDTSTLPSSTTLLPPLRIAPITLRILGG